MSASRRIRVGVLAGGASAERQISLATGLQIAEHLPKDRYEVVLLDPLALMGANPALTTEQRERARGLVDGAHASDLTPRDRALPADFQAQIERASGALVPATSLFAASGGGSRIDVAFVALHGPWGEDGKIQGVLETIGVPYTGSGVLASALAMDKVMAKTVLAAAGLLVPRGEIVTDAAGDLARAERLLPAFVKPVAQGSSLGASIVERPEQLPAAIAEALRYDDRALVEERLSGTELTVGVIGNDDPQALPVIEIVTERAFFDYQAKYDASASQEICPARIPAEVAGRAQEVALVAHRALGCRGISRTDMIWTRASAPAGPGRMLVLEVNTMPGMTANSLVPKAAREAGIQFSTLLDMLVTWALEDGRRRTSR